MSHHKVVVATGTRAEYGLLKRLIQLLQAEPNFTAEILVTGTHLSPEFGMTRNEILRDGLPVGATVEMLLSSDSPLGVAKSTGLGLIGFADALDRLQPDLLIVLGDRFEMLAAATAAMLMRVPIGHIHGGELTEGALDDAIRHSITKMSILHFTAAEEYRRRVIQLGESPSTVFTVGGLGVDSVVHGDLLDASTLASVLGVTMGKRNLLVTFHPATLESTAPGEQMGEMLRALGRLVSGDEHLHVFFTHPNADSGGRLISQRIREFCAERPGRCWEFVSLGTQRYLSLLRHADVVVGNSSSGLLEAPSLGTATVNIGSRQAGRLRAESVIDCEPEAEAILGAVREAYSDAFRRRVVDARNPYGDGGASQRIVALLKERLPIRNLRKRFLDLPLTVPAG